MSQYTFQFNDLAAYASAKASGGSIATALSGVSSTDISRSVVSYIKGIGQAVTDSVNLFVPYAKGGLAGDVLYYTGTEYCWLKSPSDALDGSVLGQNIINTSAIPTSWVRVGAIPTSESKDVQIGMQAYQPGAAMVKVEKLLGNSVAWNQLVRNGNFANVSVWIMTRVAYTVSGNVATISVSSDNDGYIYQHIPLVNGHKYYFSGSIKASAASMGRLYIDSRLNPTLNTYTESADWKHFSTITTATETGISNLHIRNYDASNAMLAKDIRFFDLTLMFGESVANTMTVEMFEKLFPLSYYEYNAGEIISNEAAAVKGIGRNLWDEEWEKGSYSAATGVKNDILTDRIRCKNYIKVVGGSTIYIKNGGASANWFPCFYDENYNYVGSLNHSTTDTSYATNTTYSVPSDACYMRFYITGGYGTTYNHDICISLSGPLNGQYEPYKESIAKLDAKKIYGKLNGTGNYVQVFPNGIRSALTVYDEVDYQSKSAVVRADSVDLGNFNWSKQTACFLTPFDKNPIRAQSTLGYSYISSVFIFGQSANNIWSGAVDGLAVAPQAISVTPRIYARQSSYMNLTADEFKAAMQGVELVYELATPKYYTDLKLSDDNGATFHDLPRPFYYTAGLEMKDPQDTASSVTAPARILAQYKPIKK